MLYLSFGFLCVFVHTGENVSVYILSCLKWFMLGSQYEAWNLIVMYYCKVCSYCSVMYYCKVGSYFIVHLKLILQFHTRIHVESWNILVLSATYHLVSCVRLCKISALFPVFYGYVEGTCWLQILVCLVPCVVGCCVLFGLRSHPGAVSRRLSCHWMFKWMVDRCGLCLHMCVADFSHLLSDCAHIVWTQKSSGCLLLDVSWYVSNHVKIMAHNLSYTWWWKIISVCSHVWIWWIEAKLDNLVRWYVKFVLKTLHSFSADPQRRNVTTSMVG